MSRKKIVCCISGSGRTLENLLKLESDSSFEIVGVLANRECDGLQFADKFKKPMRIFDFRQPQTPIEISDWLESLDTDFVVLAGFLKMWPVGELMKWPVVNIHPSLLPKYGGKGMFGMNVHRAVKEAGDSHSGATVHIVTDEYDKGPIIAQSKVELDSEESAESIADKVFAKELLLLPKALELYCKSLWNEGEVLEL